MNINIITKIFSIIELQLTKYINKNILYKIKNT